VPERTSKLSVIVAAGANGDTAIGAGLGPTGATRAEVWAVAKLGTHRKAATARATFFEIIVVIL